MKNNIEGKKYLLISNGGYAKEMQEEVEHMGGTMLFMNDKPNNGFLAKTCGRLKVKTYISLVLEKYYRNKLRSFSKEKFDTILVIRGEYTPVVAVDYMRTLFPDARIVLYMWDSIQNNKGIEKAWSYYDEVWTFDRKDYLKHEDSLHFMPLFFCEKRLPDTDHCNNWKYDLSFVGTGHGDRIAIVKEVRRQCSALGLSFYDYIYIPHILVYFYNKVFNKYYRNVRLRDVHFNRLALEEVYRIYNASKCILDAESITQSGLTMRTIEVIGSRKKLMTTNSDIRNYDFYNTNNIDVFNRDSVKVDPLFLEKDYSEIEDSVYSKYTLRHWLQMLLSENSL